MEVRAILDTGSQRSYATTRVQEVLGAKKMYSEAMIIKTFGAERGVRRVCDVIQLKIDTRSGNPLVLPMVVVPHICMDGFCLGQPKDCSKKP